MKKIVFNVIIFVAVINMSVFAQTNDNIDNSGNSTIEGYSVVSTIISNQIKQGAVFGIVLSPKASIGHMVDAQDTVAFHFDALLQGGYYFKLREGLGITLLGELGFDNFYTMTTVTDNDYSGLYANNIVIGVLPTVNIKSFSIGLGLGVKIPSYRRAFTTIVDSNNDDIWATTYEEKTPIGVIPYLKLVADFWVFANDSVAISFGINGGYEFDTKYNYVENNYNPQKGGFLGVQIGIKFLTGQ